MADVLIHRCTLRVIRRAGWSWGSDPGRLIEEAIRVLPELLAKKLAELLPDGEEREIAAPVQIRLPVRLSELMGAAAANSSAAAPGTRISQPLDRRIESALRTALGIAAAEPSPERPVESGCAAFERWPEAASPRPPGMHGTLPRLLLAWRQLGVLEQRLAALPPHEIRTWHDALRSPAARGAVGATDAEIAAPIAHWVRSCSAAAAAQEPTAGLRIRMMVAVTAAEQFSLPLTHAALWHAVDASLPVEDEPVRRGRDAALAERVNLARDTGTSQLPAFAAAAASIPSPAAQSPATAVRQSLDWDVKIACALPFLLLGPLARLGYFAALDAVLEASDLGADAPLFAVALAYKVLDPPLRGWLRSPASIAAAEALAGSRAAIAEESLAGFSRRFSSHTTALDLTVSESLIAGHSPTEPVTLHRAGPQDSTGHFVLDTQGCFPIAWTQDADTLVALLRRLGSPVVLISDEAAQPELLRRMNADGVAFVTSLPPARGECWQRINQGLTARAWTNRADSPAEPLRRAAGALGPAVDEAREFSANLILSRPGVIRAASPELERSLTLAAAVAMGMIAWTLWQGRGRTSPQQLLERYCDLEAHVQFRQATVTVDLPLGRRRQELREHGLLAPIEGVPWLGRRRIEFGGG